MDKKNCNTIFTKSKKIAGRYYPEKHTFLRTARTTHMLQRPRAWAVDLDVLHQLVTLGAISLKFRNLDTGDTWTAKLSQFLDKDISFEFDRGYGVQRALRLEHFTLEVSSKSDRARVQAEPVKPAPVCEQLSLWGRR